jgi:hypothetical protein
MSDQVWFPDDQDGYSIAICVCEGGPYLGSRMMGTPCCCETCGRMTRDQWDFLVEHFKREESPQHASGDGWPTVDTVDLMLRQLRADRKQSYWRDGRHAAILDGAESWLLSLRDYLGLLSSQIGEEKE